MRTATQRRSGVRTACRLSLAIASAPASAGEAGRAMAALRGTGRCPHTTMRQAPRGAWATAAAAASPIRNSMPLSSCRGRPRQRLRCRRACAAAAALSRPTVAWRHLAQQPRWQRQNQRHHTAGRGRQRQDQSHHNAGTEPQPRCSCCHDPIASSMLSHAPNRLAVPPAHHRRAALPAIASGQDAAACIPTRARATAAAAVAGPRRSAASQPSAAAYTTEPTAAAARARPPMHWIPCVAADNACGAPTPALDPATRSAAAAPATAAEAAA
eukprot:364647-Chlamydomonas_euryale.AAC.12